MSKLVLSLFPGIGLLDRAFEEAGFCVVRGPDCLWGGDIRKFHPPAGKFDGVIGGPPCQVHSTASNIRGTDAEDLIPEYTRCVNAAIPKWCVMENVSGVHGLPSIPKHWNMCRLRDWDCGGETSRTRLFYTWPFAVPLVLRRDGDPERSVMASTWKRGNSKYVEDKGFLRGDLPISEYGRLQGCQGFAEQLMAHKSKPSRSFVVHVLGNGVPLAMGRAIANAVVKAVGN